MVAIIDLQPHMLFGVANFDRQAIINGKRDDLSLVEWIDLGARPLPESVQELTGGEGADLSLDAFGGPLFEACLESLSQRGRQIAIASTGDPHVTFNLVNFYHKEASLSGVDTLKLSPGEAAEILQALLPGFTEGIFALPLVETVSLDEALNAYRGVVEGSSGKKFVIRFG